METMKLYENGNVYELTFKPVLQEIDGKKHFRLNGKLHTVISKIRINEITVTDEMSERIKPGY